ncbi:proximal tail sheath stabilization [Serratia phage phiMAM1]|uniref:Proximal tail sheath stabilization n=1 Tax=Serratia phage phiMAM1 TaxID=1262513 RepID=K7YB14_9CAUD|nr:proximal tail sheath stabilization [Serratia phage phiMAM1]AFX93517.1 proximal tail sheath stabilization [Serratia phage phiMAM1]
MTMAAPFEKYVYRGSIFRYLELFSVVMSRLKIDTERGLMQVPITAAVGRRNDLNRNQPVNALPVATYMLGDSFEINKAITSSYKNRLTSDHAVSIQRIPIILPVEYNLKTKKYGDALQAIEQIYTTFTPSLDVTMEDAKTLKQEQNIKIRLLSHSVIDNWENDGVTPIWYGTTFNFEIHGFIYGYDFWNDTDGGEGGGDPNNPHVIKEVIVKLSTDMNTPWQDLDEWFRVDKEGVHHPGDA